VAKGGGDLTRRLEVRRTDEIGRVMHRFNEFLATLQGIVQKIVKDSRSLATSTALLHESEERIATTSREMSGKTMSVSVIAEQASGGITSVAERSKELSESVSAMASATEEMSRSIGNVLTECNAQTKSVTNVRARLEVSRASILRLGESSREIDGVLGQIQQIASRTRLLALNATIEAAKAGEAGRGFVVVANEVKDLARQTAEATSGIEGNIKSIRGFCETSVLSLDQAFVEFQGVERNALGIAREMGEQDSGLARIAQQTRSQSDAIAVMASGVEDSRSAVAKISATSREVRDAAEANQVDVEAIVERIRELAQLSRDLEDIVSQFKT